MGEGQRERQRERDRERKRIPSRLLTVTVKPKVGLILTNYEVMT